MTLPRALKRRGLTLAGLAVACALVLSGCGDAAQARLPAARRDRETSVRVTSLWNGSWIAALAVGVLVWGLIVWCVVAYRRKKDDDGLPEQLRYNVPIEILYTVVPLFMVAVLFFYTARDETALLDTKPTPDVTVNVVGKQWSWDFNYVDANDLRVRHPGRADRQARRRRRRFRPSTCRSTSGSSSSSTPRDVIHSFWVPRSCRSST